MRTTGGATPTKYVDGPINIVGGVQYSIRGMGLGTIPMIIVFVVISSAFAQSFWPLLLLFLLIFSNTEERWQFIRNGPSVSRQIYCWGLCVRSWRGSINANDMAFKEDSPYRTPSLYGPRWQRLKLRIATAGSAFTLMYTNDSADIDRQTSMINQTIQQLFAQDIS